MKNTHTREQHDIAIVGMACRFPGNNNSPQEFFNFLLAGGDGIVEVPGGSLGTRSLF